MGNREIKQVFLPKFSFPPLYKRVGVYCRVSSNSREQLDSLSNQASEFVRRIYSHNDMKLVDIYLDIASGEKEYRSEFSRMIADTRTGKLDVLYVKSISRFGRNTEDAISALRTLKKHNVQVIFDEEGIDTLKDDSEFVITVLLAYQG